MKFVKKVGHFKISIPGGFAKVIWIRLCENLIGKKPTFGASINFSNELHTVV